MNECRENHFLENHEEGFGGLSLAECEQGFRDLEERKLALLTAGNNHQEVAKITDMEFQMLVDMIIDCKDEQEARDVADLWGKLAGEKGIGTFYLNFLVPKLLRQASKKKGKFELYLPLSDFQQQHFAEELRRLQSTRQGGEGIDIFFVSCESAEPVTNLRGEVASKVEKTQSERGPRA